MHGIIRASIDRTMRADFQVLQPLLDIYSVGRQQQLETILEVARTSVSSDLT